MAGPSNAPGPGGPEIDRLFHEPAFRELAERASPAFVAAIADGALIWANAAARRLLGARLESVPARLAAGGPLAGPAPRLKRLLIETGEGVMPLAFLTKRAPLPAHGEVLVAAVLGAPSVEAAPEPQPEAPAEEAVASSEAAAATAPETPGPEEAPPAALMTAQEVRANLLKSHRNPTVRFLWQTDEAGRVTSVTPPLAEIVGAGNADLVGRELAEIVARLRLDPSGQLLSAMQVPETWSGIEVAWPIAGAAAAVPVDLGGFPVSDPQRGFRGFRGFGVIHLDRIRDAEPPPQATEVSSVPAEEAAQPAREDAPAPVDTMSERETAPEPAPPTSPEPAPTAPNVVPLRPYGTLAAAYGLRSPAPDASASPAPEIQAEPAGKELSESEHKAFDEIARALSDDASAAAANSPAEAPDPDAAEPIGGGHAITVLDRLPLGVLISRGATAVYANRMLLDLAEHPSLEHLLAAGGLERLFAGTAPAEAANGAGTASIRTRGGNVVPVESKFQAISWEGQPASLITLRRASDGAHFASAQTLQLELQQRDAEARELRAILDAATDGVAIIDSDGRILSLNRSAETLFGYQQNEVAGEPFMMLVGEESRRVVEDYFAKLKSGATNRSADDGREVYAAARTGGTFPVFLTLGHIDSDDRPSKLCAVIRDMSSWRRAEHEAREAREEAERASAIKTDFLAKVSHEIRTPLNAIIGFAEVIMDERLGPIGTERYKDYLRDIHKSGTHVMSLVNDLLDLSKIEAGKMVLDIKSVDANAVISECVALMQPQANRERVIMRLALAPRLVQIAADERSVRQIVLNLLSNAVKYNEPGGQVIVSTAITETGHVAIRIKDTGIGMSDAELALALEPFRQVATARTVTGTGLGLPLTKALTEANRANFTIRSRKNEGTLVEVSFPPARVLAESA
jgi:PAS domain S-box-containing protein